MAQADPIVYREEVVSILIALADIVVELRKISSLLQEDDEGQEEAE